MIFFSSSYEMCDNDVDLQGSNFAYLVTWEIFSGTYILSYTKLFWVFL